MIEQRLLWRMASNIIMAMAESLVCFHLPDGDETIAGQHSSAPGVLIPVQFAT